MGEGILTGIWEINYMPNFTVLSAVERMMLFSVRLKISHGSIVIVFVKVSNVKKIKYLTALLMMSNKKKYNIKDNILIMVPLVYSERVLLNVFILQIKYTSIIKMNTI